MPAQVGDVVPAAGGGWMVLPPSHCPVGHGLGPNHVVVGHQPCSCGGHLSWRCLECDAVIYAPVLAAACSVLTGPAAVRVI